MRTRTPHICAAAFFWMISVGPALAMADPTLGQGKLRLQADRVELTPENGGIVAGGNVQLSTGPLTVRASRLSFLPQLSSLDIFSPFVILFDDLTMTGTVAHFELYNNTLRISDLKARLNHSAYHPASSLRLTADLLTCANGRCRLQNASGTGCPHQPSGYRIEAREVTIHPSRDISLRRPVFYIGSVPVAILPMLRLKRPGAKGFLPPKIGYEHQGGLILGPAFLLPVSSHSFWTTHVATRTKEGMEASLAYTGKDTTLQIDQLLSNGNNHLRTRLNAVQSSHRTALSVEGDLATDRRIIDAVNFQPEDRALVQTENRVRLGFEYDSFTFENQVTYLRPFDLQGHLNSREQQIHLRLSGLLFQSGRQGALNPSLSIQMDRRFTQGNGILDWNRAEPFLPHTRFLMIPALSVPLRAGIFVIRTQIASMHRLTLTDTSKGQSSSFHLLGAAGSIALPLTGRLLSLRHRMDLSFEYRIAPLGYGTQNRWYIDDFDMAQTGQSARISFNNQLGNSSLNPVATFRLDERFVFDKEQNPGHYLNVSAGLQLPFVFLKGESSFDTEQISLSYLSFQLGGQDANGTGVSTGGRYIGHGHGAHLDRWSSSLEPWIFSDLLLPEADALELTETLSMRLTEIMHADAGVRIGIIPDIRIHAIYYGLRIVSRCGCLELGIDASHRPGNTVPDIWTVLKLNHL